MEDEENLKKENITIDDSTKEFDNNIQKLNNLKKSIEYEMTEIDKAYDKVNNETSKAFELKRDKLKKEEDDLKEKLKTEVTKIKEKLEISLTHVNNLSKMSEKIVKGIKSLENEEKNMIKTLSYVSKINKNQKEMKDLFQELMKNLKITFIEDQNTIKYEEYYFNGIPIPKDIEFKEIESTSFKICWKIDDIITKNIDKNELKFRIEIRKENSNDKYIQYNSENNTNYLINNLEKMTNYEVRICSIYKDVTGNWTQLFKIKTSIDSVILNESEKKEEFLNKLCEWSGYNKMELLYRGTRDGSESNVFHNKCDNQGPTICLIKNDKGNIFGGYASISWSSDSGQYKSANDSFLFTLTNIHNTNPIKFPNTNSSYSVYHGSDYGPIFGGGHDLYIYNNYLTRGSSTNIGHSYQDTSGKGRSIFTGDANNNNQQIKIKELEVFKLYK